MSYLDAVHLNVDHIVENSIHYESVINKDINRLGIVVVSPSKEKSNILKVIESHQPIVTIHQEKQNRLSLEDLKKSNNLDDILKIAKIFFSEKKSLFNRLEQLIGFFNKEEEECEVSVESLKSMLVFLSKKGKFNSPSITLSEDGIFQANWRKDNLNLITLRFKNENFADYLIFESSQHTDKPEISNGSKTVFKLVEDIKKLNLNYLIEDKFNV